MNLTESGQQNNATIKPPVSVVAPDWARIRVFEWVFPYVCLALGIPGNIASAIVWLRLHKKNSSAVYLAAIAVNELVVILGASFYRHQTLSTLSNLADYSVRTKKISYWYIVNSCLTIEPLLTLGFSVERLLAICWPLKVLVCRMAFTCKNVLNI